ncbi:unnamed protein product, partial [Linum tenue]
MRCGDEAEQVYLMHLLSSLPHNWTCVSQARLVWPLELSIVFSVHSITTRLINDSFEGDNSFPYKLVWISCTSLKICYFLWM